MQIPITRKLAVLCAAVATSWAAPLLAQVPASTVPDIAGIRPGMTAQQAYDALKAHAPRAKIAIGQNIVDGVTPGPVADLMTLKIDDAVPTEVVTLWLTTPPSKQVVWAVSQVMIYPDANKLLRSAVSDALHKKLGPQTDSLPVFIYWAFDRQGSHADLAARASNCVNAQNFTIAAIEPQAPTFTYVSPLLFPMSPASPCDALTDVKAQVDGPNNAVEYVTRITLLEVDHSLVRSTKEAYQAYMANAGARQQQQELEKAKQQKAPVF